MTVSVSTWIDVSVPVRDGMVHWPCNPPVSLTRQLDRDRGDPANVSAPSLGVHTGIIPGRYELCCVPLRLAGCDASPVRALLRPAPGPASGQVPGPDREA